MHRYYARHFGLILPPRYPPPCLPTYILCSCLPTWLESWLAEHLTTVCCCFYQEAPTFSPIALGQRPDLRPHESHTVLRRTRCDLVFNSKVPKVVTL